MALEIGHYLVAKYYSYPEPPRQTGLTETSVEVYGVESEPTVVGMWDHHTGS